nr:immunoglobulin heavy chain junction region [Mus musculus]NSM04185.1 immunoglobulin heavy chain junction region [Mus musculus]NSM04275.1 immunoglobulin heavy chain junction region [Mus musculus]NSM04423.1 immunoglobulin heavy chain junction region [Mus musculus]NSM04840.1 immunoglobulin heavy chain junction region [Mus musculus]
CARGRLYYDYGSYYFDYW